MLENCIEWSGARSTAGYGQKRMNGKVWYVHRLVFIAKYGPIPEGMYICHTCDNPSCINIEHLFLGSPKDNAADMVDKGHHYAQQQHKTHCKRGHEFDAVDSNGKQVCRECNRLRTKAYRLRRSADA